MEFICLCEKYTPPSHCTFIKSFIHTYRKGITKILKYTSMATIVEIRERRTVYLTKDERKLLKAKRKLFNTDTELSEELNIGLSTLKRIMELGRGNEHNINSIKSYII